MAARNIWTLFKGMFAGHQGTDTSPSVNPHVTAAEWDQMALQYLCIFVPADAAASDTNDYTGYYAKNAITVTNAYLCPNGAATASASVYATITLQRNHATTMTTISIQTTNTTGNGGTGSWTTKQTAPFTLTTAASIALAAGDQLNINHAKASTGTALPSYYLIVEYYQT